MELVGSGRWRGGEAWLVGGLGRWDGGAEHLPWEMVTSARLDSLRAKLRCDGDAMKKMYEIERQDIFRDCVVENPGRANHSPISPAVGIHDFTSMRYVR